MLLHSFTDRADLAECLKASATVPEIAGGPRLHRWAFVLLALPLLLSGGVTARDRSGRALSAPACLRFPPRQPSS